MHNILKSAFLALSVAAFLQAEVEEFRLNQNSIWLTVRDEPLLQLLKHFAAAGVDVQADPAVAKTVTGSWRAADVETALDQMLSPYNYLLDWQRETGPLGAMTRLTGIRVFREGLVDAMQPLRNARRIETSFDGRTRFMAREMLVGFGPGASIEDLYAFLARTGGTVIGANTELGIYCILLPEGANVLDLAAQLGNESSIALAEPNYVYDLPGLLPGTGVASAAPSQWKAPADDNPIAVAVLDSGLTPGVGLDGAILSAFDATNPNAPLSADIVGHGTKMAMLATGLIDPYGRTLNEGVPVVAIKAFADDGSADSYTLMQSMTYAVQNSDGPISLSWGSETDSRFLEAAMNYATSEGAILFAAVGNENTGTPVYPAAYPNVIGVAASDGDQYAGYSNQGDFVSLVAPGTADFPGGSSSGTSVATAYASHIAAKYMRKHPDASNEDVARALAEAVAPENGFLNEAAVHRLLVD